MIFWNAGVKLPARGLGYAFSGGGARGYAHVGIIKVLEEQGIYPDYISGTSMGALVGALYALGYNAVELDSLLQELDIPSLLAERPGRAELYIGNKRWPEYGNLHLNMGQDWIPRLPSALYDASLVDLELARMTLPASVYQDFYQFPVPFVAIATDLVSGKPELFTRGSLMQALRASSSFPSLLLPFEFDGRIYIDGGVAQNLPLAEVRRLGADAVIGFKANSRLRTREELYDVVEIIDQTVNIGMTRNINAGLEDCDLLLEPDLEEWRNTDFGSADEIIAAGEAYARARLPQILALRDSLLAAGYEFRRPNRIPIPESYRIRAFQVRGNMHISSAKIREFTGLELPAEYSAAELVKACRAIASSQYFVTVYPILLPYGTEPSEGYKLVIYVKERERRQLALNLAYTSEEELNVSGVLSLNNLLLKNSNFHAGLTLGGRTDLNLDYVKNFGESWGAYFRLYPWLSESYFYLYDSESYFRLARVRALEYGAVVGAGGFANQVANLETFFYSYRKKLYRDVSATAPVDSLYLISGLGLKLYHESLNDDVFPRSGLRAFGKFNFARWARISDEIYNRFQLELDLYSPLARHISLRLGLNYGSYFGNEPESSYDPFYFSGSQGYRGYSRYAVSSPQYKIYTLAGVVNPFPRVFVETGLQGLNIEAGDTWGANQAVEWCLYLELGYRTLIGPVRASAAIRENSRLSFFINLGFDKDFFWFSRK